jgi:glutamate/tyrosine decarboxylase-like PLP-dependent enzyme
MDMNALSERLKKGGVSTVVTTMGTTATGSVDPLTDILELQKAFGFRIHCDAAYGGYFTLTENLRPETRAAFDAMSAADSIVIDPHKHGLQPYGCGCVLFRDPGVGRFYKHDSPYTYFSSGDLHLGEISLECSRAGAAAVALWATQRMFPLVRAGAFARGLQRGRSAALRLFNHLKNDRRFVVAFEPELDIVVWTVRSESLSRSSEMARNVFDACAKAGLHLALAELPAGFFQFDASVQKDRDTVVCLRSVLMKPEHEEWVGKIAEILNRSLQAVKA